METKEIQKLMDFLKGKKHEKLCLAKQPKLSEDCAFSIIYYLQEIMGIIPDCFEKCDRCGIIFKNDDEGEVLPDFKEFEEIGLTNTNFTKKDEYKHYCKGCFDNIRYGRR